MPGAVPGADEGLAAVDAALVADIEALAQGLRTGPVASRGARLASLRMVAVARALDRSASPDAAREALQRALDLDASDPYACFWMARRERDRADEARLQHWLACAKRHAATARALGAGTEPRRPGVGAGR